MVHKDYRRLGDHVDQMFPGSGLDDPSHEERQRAHALTGTYIGGGNRAHLRSRVRSWRAKSVRS